MAPTLQLGQTIAASRFAARLSSSTRSSENHARENRRAYAQLADAVEEIRDILGSQGSSIGDAVGGAISNAFGGGGGDDKKKGGDGMNKTLQKMNATMGRLQSTMGQLPASIQSIKIVVED